MKRKKKSKSYKYKYAKKKKKGGKDRNVYSTLNDIRKLD